MLCKNKDSEYYDNSINVWNKFLNTKDLNYKKEKKLGKKLLPFLGILFTESMEIKNYFKSISNEDYLF